MTRRSFQQGYVSNPIQTRRGTAYKIRYRVRAADGKWKHKSEVLYGVSGKKAARAELAQRLQEATGQAPEASELTLRHFVETYWMPYLERKGIKPSTRQFYECNLNKHLLPRLGDLRLVEISPLHVEELLRGNKNLSPRTLRNVLAVLQCIFSHAVDNDLITRSPVRNRHRPVVPRREKPVWTPEQVRTILGAAPQAHRCLFTCVALTGLRMGELLALQWKHIDLEKRRIQIKQSLWHGQLVPPKTAGSVRMILIGEILGKALAEHHRNSCHTSTEDFVFCKPDGSLLDPNGLRRDVLYPMLDRSGIPRPPRDSGFHAFRHAAASFINAQTGNLKLAQKFLGHADLSTTADIYTHTLEQEERGAADAIERAVFGDLFPVVPESGTATASSPNPNEQPLV